MREIIIPKEVEKILGKIQKGDHRLAKNISEHILNLENNPFPEDSLSLQGHFPCRRIRVGKYRIVYIGSDESITIIYVGKREDVYEKMKKYIAKNI